jgi:hypothetical protein
VVPRVANEVHRYDWQGVVSRVANEMHRCDWQMEMILPNYVTSNYLRVTWLVLVV